jgi:CheY-like chemotaxis protein/HPt (histidine-containing phosphotransfer) domain-containing protein
MEAIDKIQRGNYGLVLMDCQMPKLDGYQATEEIRRLEKQRLESGEPITPLVIIALTAHSFPGEREKCLNAGMDEYLPKPIRLHKLISLVQQWYPRQDVEFTTNREYILETEQQSTRHKKNFTASDDRPLDAIKDEEFATEISDLYRTETKKHLDQLTEALSEGNAEEITRIAHALRGNALSLDEDATARVAEQIERAGDQRALDEVRELLVEIKRLQLT